MHDITLSKIPGARYDSRSFKSYEARKGSEVVGTIAQDYSGKWEVVTPRQPPHHYQSCGTRRRTGALISALWLDVEVYADREEELQAPFAELAEEGADDELPPHHSR